MEITQKYGQQRKLIFWQKLSGGLFEKGYIMRNLCPR